MSEILRNIANVSSMLKRQEKITKIFPENSRKFSLEIQENFSFKKKNKKIRRLEAKKTRS